MGRFSLRGWPLLPIIQPLLRKLRQNGYDNLNRRAYLRPVERVALIPRAVVGVVAGGRQ